MIRIGHIPAVVVLAAVSCKGALGDYDAEGYFETAEVTVSAEASGRILFFDAEEGDTVAAGSLLGCIDTVQLHLTRKQLEMTYRSVMDNRPDVGSQLEAMEEQLRKLALEKERVSRLLEDGAVDLGDLARTVFILEMDTKTLCSEDCKGICPGCGVNLNQGKCVCKKDVDPRLAVLAQLLERDHGEEK